MAAASLLEGIGSLNRLPSQAAQTKYKTQIVKKVSWAPEYDLCQVRLFLAEDAPLQSGLGVQDQLQAKRSWLWHAGDSGIEGDLPPGFVTNSMKRRIQEEDSIVQQATWRCPPRFVLDPAWQVVAGDESQEVKVQCEREVRILEAIYPRPSAIPPSPTEPPEPQEEYEDCHTPLIPLTPVEDDDHEDLDHDTISPCMQNLGESGVIIHGPSKMMDNKNGVQLTSTGMLSQGSNLITASPFSVDHPMCTPQSGPSSVAEPDVAAAAAAAFMAITRTNEEGSLIDHDLLIKILSNPQIIETLTAQYMKNKNSVTNSIPISLPNNNKHNGPQFTCTQDLSPPTSKAQGAPTVVLGNSKSSVATSEIVCSNFQGPSHLPTMETKSFGMTVAAAAAQTTSVPLVSSAPLPSSTGLATSHLVSKPTTIPITTAKAVFQPSNGAPAATPAVSTETNWPDFQEERYYKNLNQRHGLQNNNDQNKCQNELQYYKDLIQQHGGLQSFEEHRGWVSKMHCGNNDRGAGNFASNERSYSAEPNRLKFRKPCMYFNTPHGCRRGTSCAFLHEELDRARLDVSDIQHSKRMKVEIEAPERKC